MYTLESLQSKTFKELKEIGWQLNVLPAGDRRQKQTWIDALVGVNPPLLQLLEVSPSVEVDRVQEAIEVQAQEAIEIQVQELIEVQATEVDFDRIVYPRAQRLIDRARSAKTFPGVELDPVQDSIKLGDWVKVTRKPRLASGVKRGEIFQVLRINSFNGALTIENPHENPKYILSARMGLLDPSEVCLVPRSNRPDTPVFIDVVTRNFPDRLQELLQNPPGVDSVQEPIAPEVKTSPGVSFDVEEFQHAHAGEIENYFASFTEADRPPNRGDSGRGRLESEPKLSQSAILFEGCANGFCASPVTFSPSPKFLATYPPYFGEIRYKAEVTGQLNLLEPETDDEPPDPDDFESLDAFREAIARWDAEHCEPLAVSMDSMCEWAPCPDEWYEPEAENLPLKASSMRELSAPAESSSTSVNFSIPTFDRWCDRANRQNDTDEPPDTGIFARLPGPKPPKFPPGAIESDADKKSFNANRHTSPTRTITYCIAAGDRSSIKKFARSATLLSGRAPPGGDAMP